MDRREEILNQIKGTSMFDVIRQPQPKPKKQRLLTGAEQEIVARAVRKFREMVERLTGNTISY